MTRTGRIRCWPGATWTLVSGNHSSHQANEGYPANADLVIGGMCWRS